MNISRTHRCLLIIGAGALSACTAMGSTLYPDDGLVSVPAIIGSLKCAFAEALVREAQEQGPGRLRGKVAAGYINLKVVAGTNVSASIGAKAAAGGPFVFPFHGGQGSILPSLSGSVDQSNTIETRINFRYLLEADNVDACRQTAEDVRARYGFSQWLSGLVAGIGVNARTDPKGRLDSVVYDAAFGVNRVGGSQVDFNVIFLTASAKATASRNDVQQIHFAIAPPSKDNPPPGNGTDWPAQHGVN